MPTVKRAVGFFNYADTLRLQHFILHQINSKPYEQTRNHCS